MERNISMIALFAALIAVLGLVPKLTLAFGVPITAQTLGVMLCGTILGARRGALAVLLFLLLTALGLPLLSGGRGGLGVFVSPSAGFLVGWPVGAYVTGLIVTHWRGTSLALGAGIAAGIGCILVLYLFGIIGMAIGLSQSLPKAATLVLAFVPGDILKAIIAGLITRALFDLRPGAVLSRSDGTEA